MLQKKMEDREYRTIGEFAEDVRQIFHNCYRYNPPDSDVAKMGRKLQVSSIIRSTCRLYCLVCVDLNIRSI